MIVSWNEKGNQRLNTLNDNPLVSYTQLTVATRKNKSKMSEAKEMRSRAAVIQTVEDNSKLAALTKEMAYLMATLDTKKITTSNQRKERGTEKKGMVWAGRDQTITIEIVLIEIMVAMVIKIKYKGTAVRRQV